MRNLNILHMVRLLKSPLYQRFMIAALVLLLAPLAIAEAKVPVFKEDFEARTNAVLESGGRLVPSSDGVGWSSPVGGDTGKTGTKNYLAYDISVLNPDQGTISFNLMRDNQETYESLFSVVDEEFNDAFDVLMVWDRDNPRLKIGTRNAEDVAWKTAGNYSTWIDIPRISRGDWTNFTFTWGPNTGDNAIYVNGQRLDLGLDNPSTIPEMIRRSAYLVFGGLLEGSGSDDAYSMLSSTIDDIQIFDVIYNPFTPTIKSLAHDAFSVAGYSGKLVAGDSLTVVLRSEAGGTATFDLVQPASVSKGITTMEKTRVAGHPMSEDPDSPGTYRGTHVFKYGEDIEEGQIVGHFINSLGLEADAVAASESVTVDTGVYMNVRSSNDLIPADRSARAGLTVAAADANGKSISDHEIKLTLSTTDEYTGTVGGGSFEDLVGGSIDVDWGGVTDSFGEVTAQYRSGFAAKSILVSAKDMVSGDVGVGWVRSFIDGTVDIVVTEPKARALSVAGSMDVSLSRQWLTADGQGRSRITVVVKDASGKAISGHSMSFTLLGSNGEIRVIQGKTDSRGRALADYIAGTVMGQVQVEARDLTSGLVTVVAIELRPDAPAEIELAADPGEVATGGQSTVRAKVTDANGNANHNVDVLYNIMAGGGVLGSPSVPTDKKGVASVQFTAGDTAGLVTLRGTVISRAPTAEEISAAQGAVFLYGLDEDPGRLELVEWLVKAGDEVVEGQDLVTLEDRAGTVYTVRASRDGIVSTFTAEEKDRVQYGDTLGYVIEIAE